MLENAIRNIVIVGGGTAGWMTAAAMSHFFGNLPVRISLIESDQIGTVGVGEATLPHLRFFNQMLGIDENDFMRKTQATYKLGNEFVNWGRQGDAYMHPFGNFRFPEEDIDFHQLWLKQRQGGDAHSIGEYSLAVAAAKRGRFSYPAQDPGSLLSTFSYAFHLDASLYARYLRDYSESKGVTRIEGKVTDVTQQGSNGFIESVTLESGDVVAGELFIDCSGFSGLLIEKTLKTGFEDWSHWLPCDRAVAIPCESAGNMPPYTRATAREAGWQWRIPLQHRMGNGHVYSSGFIADDKAANILLENLDGEPLAEPAFLRFNTGKRKQCWNKNCVAIGLSGGFLEPLESTSIYLIQIAIMKLREFFPDVHFAAAGRNEFNRLIDMEYERVKDFLILHYHATERTDSEFWNYCRTMSIPDSLQSKMALFREQGHIVEYQDGLFSKPSWVAVYLGQGVIPKYTERRADALSAAELHQQLDALRASVSQAAESMPAHAEQLAKHCAPGTQYQAPRASMSLYGSRQ
ncbi:MAG: tryptophan halogenase family protein [Pseudomonadales bacterium]